jgi:MFS family permease
MLSQVAVRFGRRGAMLGGVATMMVAAGLLAAWKDLPGLLIGRLLTGVAVGLAAGVAITYLIELRLRGEGIVADRHRRRAELPVPVQLGHQVSTGS